MDHLLIALPGAVVEATRDADPTLAAYARRSPLGLAVFGGPLLGVAALSAGPLVALSSAAAGTAVLAGLLVIGHARHRRAVEADRRTAAVRTAAALVADFNALAPRLEALIRHPPPDTAELFAEARQLRMRVQSLVGQADAAVADQPRLGQTGPRRSTIQPLTPTSASAVRDRIEALAARLTEEEALPPGVLRFPRRA